MSRVAAKKRVQKLEKDGIIRGYKGTDSLRSWSVKTLLKPVIQRHTQIT